MKELELEEILLPRLRSHLPHCEVDARQALPYAAGDDDRAFKVDILVREKSRGIGESVPRVVIELKGNGVTTHDLIVYSYKAALHRSLSGHLRYGLFVAGDRSRGVTAKWLWHGQMFDFMLSCVKDRPKKRELDKLVEIISYEVEASKKLEQVLSRRRGPYPHFFWRKAFIGDYG
ncbi:MAG: hypothetical protein IH865_11900 [Chloroflexi bacterium]|nr:hypothetical protein [Chloroflexota bacterium]